MPTPDMYDYIYEFELGHDNIDVTVPPDTPQRKHKALVQFPIIQYNALQCFTICRFIA